MFTEDLSGFFNVNDFAIAAVVGATTIPVILDAPYGQVLDVSGTDPTALCKKADAAIATVGSTIVISGITYIVRGQNPQDDGANVLLQLEKQ